MVRGLIGADSEPAHSTYFTRRLEAFNDVVFGFTLSILATQLQSVDFSKPGQSAAALAIYFGTFALTASIWYTQYQTFHFAFVGESIDVVLNFVLLAFAVLVPLTASRVMVPSEGKRVFVVLIPYAVAFATVFCISGILKLRGLKRFGDQLEPAIQKRVFRSAIVGIATPVVFGIAVVVSHFIGYTGTVTLWLLAIIAIVTRRMKRVPANFLPETPSRS